MDLNYLYHHHQVSLHKSVHAACECSRAVHRSLAEGYASQIALAKHFYSILEVTRGLQLGNPRADRPQ